MKKLNWGHKIAMVYTTFALGTMAVVGYSFTQKVELVSEDNYEQGVKYEEHILRVKNAQQLQSAVQCTVDDNHITINFPLTPSGGEILLYNTQHSNLDATIPVSTKGLQQVVSTQQLAAGKWRVKINWTSAGKEYYAEHNFNK